MKPAPARSTLILIQIYRITKGSGFQALFHRFYGERPLFSDRVDFSRGIWYNGKKSGRPRGAVGEGTAGPAVNRRLVQGIVKMATALVGAGHEQFVPGIVKKGKTNCVCSGAHCAAVGGFAALRMRRAPLRVVSALYRAIQPREGAGAPRASLMCHCEEANGRRGNLGKAVTFSPGVPCDPTGFCEIPTSLRSSE